MRIAVPVTNELSEEVLVEAYLTALDAVVAAGFSDELDWQEQCRLDRLTEPKFLREAAWVILSSGMRERVIHDRFPRISSAFLDWVGARQILRRRAECARAALRVFRHPGKIDAILAVAESIQRRSFEAIHSALMDHGIEAIDALPYIGPVTRFHLAKNLGLDVVKPDRHLVRLALSAGFTDPDRLCRIISSATGDRIGTVDLVFWRFATLNSSYTALFDHDEGQKRC